jgi:hypothetical protein
MTIQEICDETILRIKPQLDELGFEGFVLVGYARDTNGNVGRCMIADGKNNPMIKDALQPMVHMAMAWHNQGQPKDK